MPKAAIKTIAALAKALTVTTKAVGSWRDNFSDWPGREPNGTFDVKKHRAFCKRNRVGPFNPHRGEQAQASRDALREATRQHIIERGAKLKVDNERLREKQRRELANLLSAADVRADLGEFRNTILATAAVTVTAIDAEMAAGVLVQPELAETRNRVAALLEKFSKDAGNALQGAFS